MGWFDFLNSKSSSPKPASPQAKPSAYKCLGCGAELHGMVLYCDGCNGYLCRNCGIPASGNYSGRYTCPNCSSRCEFFTLA